MFSAVFSVTLAEGANAEQYVADAKADDLLFRMLLRIDRHLLCDGGKQIAFGKVLVVFIDLQFVFPPAS